MRSGFTGADVMLDIKFIRENTSFVKEAVKNRNMAVDIDEILAIDDERKLLLGNVEALKQKRNTASTEISGLKKDGEDTNTLISETKAISQKIKELDEKLGDIDKKLRKNIMNIITDSTPMEDPKNPDTCNVFNIYKLIASPDQIKEMRGNYEGGNYGYGHAKQALFELIVETYKNERALWRQSLIVNMNKWLNTEIEECE